MFQIAILLQFNESMSRSITELVDATTLPKEMLQQVVQILVKNRLLVSRLSVYGCLSVVCTVMFVDCLLLPYRGKL